MVTNRSNLSQKDYKQMKREVREESALGIGFYYDILKNIHSEVLLNAIKKISKIENANEIENNFLLNILVTESIRLMSYQEFKDAAPCLFSYPQEQRTKDLEVKPIKISKEFYEELQTNTQHLMTISPHSLTAQIENLETDRPETRISIL